MTTERQYAMWLSGIPGIGPHRLQRLQTAFSSFQAVWEADSRDLEHVQSINPKLAFTIVNSRMAYSFDQHQEILERHQIQCVLLDDPDYPEPLRDIHDPPFALYIKGSWLPQDRFAIGVVGSRTATNYGFVVCKKLSEELSRSGITVISGLARGIDSIAHESALRAGGRTIAVLGGGIATLYPSNQLHLAESIVKNGAIISEYPPFMPAIPQQFPARNRIISGLSKGVLVIEAGVKSGSLITADQALEQGRDVFAVPGPINSAMSKGTNQLIRQGAKMVTCLEDIWEELILTEEWPSGEGESIVKSPGPFSSVPAGYKLVLEAIGYGGVHINQLLRAVSLDLGSLHQLLLTMELEGYIKQMPGQMYVRLDV